MSSALATQPAPFESIPAPWASAKLKDHHLKRSAIVYVRQSSAHQVQENRESTARQYALVERAMQLGWARVQVEVIDEDQGRSGATAEGRLGFQRLLAEVSLDHVGIVLGIEMSRLARSNKDWHQLLELCAIFRTLLADQDGLYDPTDYNDRLLLGLKGTMSEAELHILQGRMHQALLNKARRGELCMLPPVGYVKRLSGEFTLDPDEQAQGVIRLIFDEFDRLGSMRRVLCHLHEQDIKMPIRPHTGPSKGDLEWRRASRDAVRTVLMHPLYSGTYRYGHRQTDARRKKAGRRQSGRVVVKPDQYHALIPDRCPGYITRARYERNQERIRENRIRLQAKGPPRNGEALLGGILFCARCQRRMSVHYSGREKLPRYVCRRDGGDGITAACQCLSGRVLDQLIGEKVLQALEPAALELSLLAADDLHQQRQRLDQHWRQRLERARYQAERAERHYRHVEPENRLVARELGRQWEAALNEQTGLEQQYARFGQSHPATLSEQERERIRTVAQDLPAVWRAETTSPSDRKRITRLLICRVTVEVQDDTDHVDAAIEWTGGFTSHHVLTRPVRRYHQMQDYDQLVQRIEKLRGQGCTFAEIARCLNEESFRPIRGAKRFYGDLVCNFFNKLCLQNPAAHRIAEMSQLQRCEWFALELAARLRIPKNTLLHWVRRGWVHLVRQLPGYRGRVICWADEQEINRLERLRDTSHHWWDPPLPEELTTPNSPDMPKGCVLRSKEVL
jgi:DNA invertase Pin-like site-specific DNA recombinase